MRMGSAPSAAVFAALPNHCLPGAHPCRYLWTDAFGVVNYLTLACETGEQHYLEQAAGLIDGGQGWGWIYLLVGSPACLHRPESCCAWQRRPMVHADAQEWRRLPPCLLCLHAWHPLYSNRCTSQPCTTRWGGTGRAGRGWATRQMRSPLGAQEQADTHVDRATLFQLLWGTCMCFPTTVVLGGCACRCCLPLLRLAVPLVRVQLPPTPLRPYGCLTHLLPLHHSAQGRPAYRQAA